MDGLKNLWQQALDNRQAVLGASAATVVVGVLLIAIGEVQEWGWTRLVGAGLISLGAVVFGVLVGWSDPIRPRASVLLRSWSRGIVALLTLIMVTPLFAGFLMAFGGILGDGSSGEWYVMLLGLLIIIALLVISAGTVAVAITLALQGLDESAGRDSGENGQGDA